MSSHLRSSPNAEAHHLWILAFFLAEPIDGFARKLLSDTPRSLGWQRTGIDGVEVSTRWQDMGHATSRGTCGASGNVLAFQSVQKMLDLIPGLFEIGHELGTCEEQRLRYLGRCETEYSALNFSDSLSAKAERLQHGEDVERCTIEQFEHVRMGVASVAEEIARRRQALTGFVQE